MSEFPRKPTQPNAKPPGDGRRLRSQGEQTIIADQQTLNRDKARIRYLLAIIEKLHHKRMFRAFTKLNHSPRNIEQRKMLAARYLLHLLKDKQLNAVSNGFAKIRKMQIGHLFKATGLRSLDRAQKNKLKDGLRHFFSQMKDSTKF